MRNILLTVAGKTPATVTEALWGLAVQRGVPIHGLRVLTTAVGAVALRRELREAVESMAIDYPQALAALQVDWEHDVRVCRGPGRRLLNDIRNEAENCAVADWILREAADCCADHTAAVHASLAGGRRTMSFFLGDAMQFVGRDQDRLYHVLVSPEGFEIPGFYYPTPRDRFLQTRSGKLNARLAQVDMAEVPFVQLCGVFAENSLRELVRRLSFNDLVARARSLLAGPKLAIHVLGQRNQKQPRPRIEFRRAAEGQPLLILEFQKVDTLEFILYTYLLAKRQEDGKIGLGATPRRIPIFREDQLALTFHDLLSWLRRLAAGDGAFDPQDSRLFMFLKTSLRRASAENITDEQLTKLRAEWYHLICTRIPKLHDKLARSFHRAAPGLEPSHYTIKGMGHDIPAAEKGCWYLDLPPELIHFHPDLE